MSQSSMPANWVKIDGFQELTLDQADIQPDGASYW